MNDRFETEFDKHIKTIERTRNVLIAVYAAWALFSLSLLAGIIYVAVHFIRKFW